MDTKSLLRELCQSEGDESPEILAMLDEEFKAHPEVVNLLDSDGLAPLHYAADRRLLELTKLLLRHGADPNLSDSKGRVPFVYLIDDRLEIPEVVSIAKSLLEHGANPNAIYYAQRPVHYEAVFASHEQIAALLEQHGAVVTLNAALLLGQLDRIREILRDDPYALRHAPDPDRIASDALSPSYWPTYDRATHAEILRLLFDAGLDPNSRAHSDPLLVRACKESPWWLDSSIIAILIERGADVNARGYTVPDTAEKGPTPLDVAISREDSETMALLRAADSKTSAELDV